MSDIFISYSSEDKSRVQDLARALERKGWSVWWDRRIPAGKSFDEVIHDALKVARSVVVVWTKTSVKSTWVKNESRNGMRRNMLFPVMLLDEVEIPLEFEHLQAAHLMDWHPEQDHAGFDQFIDDLAGVIGPPVTSSSQPKSAAPSEESAHARAESKPESQTEPLSTTVVEVEAAPERLEPKPATEMTGSGRQDVARDAFMSQDSTEFSEVRQEPVQVNEGRSRESAGIGQSADTLPYVPIGIALLAVIGALVYFLLFSQGSSPVREVAPYQPAEQAPSARTEVVTPAPVPESVTPSAATPTNAKPPVKREATNDEPMAAKPRPAASPVKTITGKDGAPMVLVPAGEFWMGSSDGEGNNNERPRHRVILDSFYIDQYEVTTTRYAPVFHEANDLNSNFWPANVVSQHGRKPVVGVSWWNADRYCALAGKRLPTEAEWEKAARGTDERLYPWGNEAPTERHANFGHCCEFKDYGALADVGLFELGKSPYGAYDMAGNVWEWTADSYDENYYSRSPNRNPKGPDFSEFHVLRGGSWSAGPDTLRSAYRFRGTHADRDVYIGFRCARDVPK